MFLTVDVARVLAVYSMIGQTWAGEGVFDSPAETSDIRVQGDRAPFIAAYVDDADSGPSREAKGMGLDNSGSILGISPTDHTRIRLIVEVGVARETAPPSSAEALPPPEPDESEEPAGTGGPAVMYATDEGLEMTLGFLASQAANALTSVSTGNPWSELLRKLCAAGGISAVGVRRGGPPGDGKLPKPRYASRVLLFDLGVLAEPPPGSKLSEYPVWNEIVNAFIAEKSLKPLGGLLQAHFEGAGLGLSVVEFAQKALGVPRETLRAIGIVGLPDEPQRDGERLTEIRTEFDPWSFRPAPDVGGSELGDDPDFDGRF